MSKDGKQAPLDTTDLPELPRGWCWATVGQVGEVRLGRQRSPKNRSDKYPTKYLRAANITWTGLDLTDVLDMDFKPQEREAYRLIPGDVLLSEASGSPNEVGKPAIWDGSIEDCCFQNTVIRFRPRVPSPKFAHLIFCHFARTGTFARVGKGVGIHHLSADRFSQLPFPVPPLAEQDRIVAKVEELFSDLDAGVAALLRVKLKRYRAAVLKAAVEGQLTEQWRAAHPATEPARKLLERILTERRGRWEAGRLKAYAADGKDPPPNWKDRYREPTGPDESNLPQLPEGWCWATVDQLLYGIKAGKSFECLPRPASEDEWGVIKVSAMTWGEFLEGENKAIPCNKPFDLDTEIRPGDVLLSRSNTVQLVGATVLVKDCRRRRLLSDKSMRLLVNDLVDRAWFQKAMSSRIARRQLSAMATGTSDSMRNVSQEKVLTVALPLPPLDEQTQIVGEIEQRCSIIDGADSQVAVNLKRSHRLRQAVLKRAFEGKLVPQDPHDEPASVLLERTKTAAGVLDTIKANDKSAGRRPRRSAITTNKETEP